MTNQTKHTPGPWNNAGFYNEADMERCYITSKGKGIAWLYGDNDETIEANANLIAAAPELLEALKLAYQLLEDGYSDFQDLAIMEKAIGKAEGRE